MTTEWQEKVVLGRTKSGDLRSSTVGEGRREFSHSNVVIHAQNNIIAYLINNILYRIHCNLHTKFQMLTLNAILVPVSNQEASIDFCSLHFIILHFLNLNKRWLLFEYVLWYIIWDSTVKGSTANPSLYVILLLLITVGNLKLGEWVGLQWHNIKRTVWK